MAFTTVAVTETFNPDAPGGATPTGSVTFTLSERIHDGSGHEVEPEPIVVPLTSGAISASLYANDDTTTVPSGSFYTVEFFLAGVASRAPIEIIVPHTAPSGTCTLASLS